jgi:hypothetical protein
MNGIVSATRNAVDFVQAQEKGSSSPPLRLAPLETLALERLVVGDATEVVEHARGIAEALSGDNADAVRRHVLAKALAGERTLQCLLTGILADRLSKKNGKSAAVASSA